MPNGRWRVEFTIGWDIIKQDEGDEVRKRVRKTKSGFRKKRDALEWLAAFKAADEPIRNITFKELYDIWSEKRFKKVSKDTAAGYKSAFNYSTNLYYRQFSLLKTADLENAIDKCPHGHRTKENMKSLYNNMYKYAIANDYCHKNYASYIKLGKRPKSKKDSFTLAERNKFWKDYERGNEFTGYILIMIYTGMRYGEISTIEKENIHLKEQYMEGGIKTDAGIDRIIPISNHILPIVSKFYHANDKKLLEMHEKVFYNKFYETLERLKVRELKPHDCRHTFATIMAQAGVQPAIITATAGHEDYQTTLEYTHIPLETILEAANSVK